MIPRQMTHVQMARWLLWRFGKVARDRWPALMDPDDYAKLTHREREMIDEAVKRQERRLREFLRIDKLPADFKL